MTKINIEKLVSIISIIYLYLDNNEKHKDAMSLIIGDIRTMMNMNNLQQMNREEIVKRLGKVNPSRYGQRGFTKDNVFECLVYYKKLNVVYIDDEGNVIFL